MSTRTVSSRRKLERGLTLVELMVAMLLGLLVTGGVIQVFLGNRATYAFNEGLSRLQENGRFALDTLNHRVRMSGYFGCISDARTLQLANNLNGTAALAFNFEQSLTGFEAVGSGPNDTVAPGSSNPANSANAGDWTPPLPADLLGSVVPGSDVIVLRSVSSAAHSLISPFTTANQVFVDAPLAEYQPGEIAVVSDCLRGSVFQITNVAPGAFGVELAHAIGGFVPGNSVAAWDFAQSYGAGSELLRAETWVFYVGARPGGGPPALFQRRLQLAGNTVALVAEELVEAVDTMQVLYGEDVDLDGAVDQYVTANNVADWTRVAAVRISLLMRSPEEYGTEFDTQTYDVNETRFNPADDRRVRQVFTTAAAIRNRLP